MLTEDARKRLADFTDQATRIFMSTGYRRSKMSDVTRAMGLSEGAIYRYFEGKEALFDLVLRQAVDARSLERVTEVPVPNPEPGDILAFLRQTLEQLGRFESLERAVRQPAGEAGARAELEAIVREIYAMTNRFRVGIRVMERCSMDWPELAAIWFGGRRRELLEQVAAYFEDRIERGWLRPVPSAKAVAMLIFDEAAFFVMHRHVDPWQFEIGEDIAEATMIDNIVNSYAPLQPATEES